MITQKGCVLVVEDDIMIGRLLASLLAEHDIAVAGPLRTVREALQALRTHRIDCALLDVKLRGGEASPIAEELSRLKVPFIVMSGRNVLPTALAVAPRLTKPFRADELLALLKRTADAKDDCPIPERGTYNPRQSMPIATERGSDA